MGLNSLQRVTFGMANNCYNQTLKSDRVFDTGCLAINSKGDILADACYVAGGRKNSFLDKSLRVREAPFFYNTGYNDEQIIKVDLARAEKAGVKYLYFYMFGPDIDANTPKMIDTLEKTHYHIFDNKTNVNFHRVSNAATLHAGLLTYTPEAKEAADDEDEPPKNNLWMGCYIVHLKEKTWTVESLKAYVSFLLVNRS
jgi:hypothetical protein